MRQENLNQFYKWIQPLADKDSVEFDLHGFFRDTTEVTFQKKSLNQCSQSLSKQISLRVLKGEKEGSSFTKDFSQEGLKACYQQALNSLNFTDKKERGGIVPPGETYKECFYDENSKVDINEKIQKTQEMNMACLNFDKKVQPVSSSLYDYDSCSFFVNSLGAKAWSRSKDIVVFSQSLAVQGDSRANGMDAKNAKNYKGIDFEFVGKSSASRAIKKLNYIIPKTGEYPVIFQSGEVASKLVNHLVDLMNGKSVFEKTSLFKKESLGKKELSDKLSIYDDPFAPCGFGFQSFDGEGFPMEKTSLITKGVLDNYLTSSFSAKALNVPHTKKAFWLENRGLNPSFTLSVSPAYLVMEEGDSSFEELTKEFPKTVLIDCLKGLAGYSPISGDFSIESEGFLLEGDKTTPLCQFTVSGNIKDVFSDILKVGKDSQTNSLGLVKAPSFLLPKLMIAGG